METATIQQAVDTVFCTLMADRGTPLEQVDPTQCLYEGGYGLDSMDTATFSAMLSERFDDDPYLTGIFPQNIAEIVVYYENRATSR